MNKQPPLTSESYKRILDSIIDIAHTMNLSVDDIEQTGPWKDVKFSCKAIGNALSQLVEAVWDIEEIMPELKGYYEIELTKRSNQNQLN